MRTNEADGTIAVQPETDIEQKLVAELFTRLNRIADADDHPEKIGSLLCYYTLDVDNYPDLDHDLWESVECGVDENGRLDPEPGSRALVVVHDPQTAYADEEEAEEEHSQPTEEDIDNAVEMLAEDAPEREVEEPLLDPSTVTIPELRESLEDDSWTVPTLRGVYEAELDGEARKGALRAISDALDEMTEQEVVEA